MKIDWSDIILIALVALVSWNIRGCFTPVHKPEEMIRNEERLKVLEAQRKEDSVTLVQTRERYDSLIAASLDRVQSLENKKQPIKIIYEKVPVIVSNLDKEQLRSGAINY